MLVLETMALAEACHLTVEAAVTADLGMTVSAAVAVDHTTAIIATVLYL